MSSTTRAASTSRSSTSVRTEPASGQGAPEHVPRLRLALPRRRARREPSRLPAVRAPLPGAARASGSRSSPIQGTFVEEDAELRSADPLEFFDLRPYTERLAEAEVTTGLGDAIVTGRADDRGAAVPARGHGLRVHGRLDGKRGRREVRARVRACGGGTASPLVSVSASGGARMQEGILALMQLPKTVCAIDELHERRRRARLGAHAPDHRRRARELREPRRRRARRAGRADVVRRARASSRRRRARSSRTTSASPSRTSASATSTRSSRAPSCARRSPGSCACFGNG